MQLALRELTGERLPFGTPLPAQMATDRTKDAERIAAEIRSQLGIEVDEQIKWPNAEAALAAWRDSIERHGVFVFKRAFEQKSVSGFCLPDMHFPVVYLNNSHHFTRQIFTLGHELAHLVFGRAGITAEDESFVDAMNPRDRRVEGACDALAEALLIPSFDVLDQLPQNREATDPDVARLSRRYHVSEQVVLYRLARVTPDRAASYVARARERAARGYQRPKPDQGGGNWYATHLSYLGRNFLRVAFQSQADGRVTYEQLADSIGVKARNLPGLEQRLYQADKGE